MGQTLDEIIHDALKDMTNEAIHNNEASIPSLLNWIDENKMHPFRDAFIHTYINKWMMAKYNRRLNYCISSCDDYNTIVRKIKNSIK